MKVEMIPAQLVGYEFKNQINENRVIEENQKVTNDYYSKSNQYVGTDAIGRKLDLSSLISTEGGYLKGNLSDINDVDYFKFSIASYRNLNMVEQYNKDIVITLDNVPEDCNYDIILYDENGNQVGVGVDNGKGGKSIVIPNWNNSTEFCVKIMAQDNVKEEDYHISFSTLPAKEDNRAYLQNQEKQKYLGEFRRKLHDGEDCTAEKEALKAIDEKYQKIYAEKLGELHEKQAQEVAGNSEQLTEGNIESLLAKLSEGKELTDSEKKMIQIFATASEYDKATACKKLSTNVSEQIIEMVKKENIDISDKDILISIRLDGKVSVSGISGEEEIKKITEILEKKFTDKLWKNYISASQETRQMTNDEKEILKSLVCVESFLYKTSGGKIQLGDLNIKTNGYIEGLPNNISGIINYPNNNLRYDIQRIKKFLNMGTNDSLSLCTATFEMKGNMIQIVNGSI